MMDKYLPIGSVVLLNGGSKRIMIYGRKQKELNSDKVWDYITCLYQEGNLNEEYVYLFNHDQIVRSSSSAFRMEKKLNSRMKT